MGLFVSVPKGICNASPVSPRLEVLRRCALYVARLWAKFDVVSLKRREINIKRGGKTEVEDRRTQMRASPHWTWA